MSAEELETWLVAQRDAGMSASTRNGYREAAVCFGNWCRRTRRMTWNPFADVPRADPKTDRRHQRRALTEDEIIMLLNVARLRPLAEYGRKVVRKTRNRRCDRRSRSTWTRSPLTVDTIDEAAARAREALRDNPAFLEERERIGRKRRLIDKTLVLTGLRKSELDSLTIGQLDFTGPVAYAVLNAADEKNRQGSNIPIRADLAAELEAWLQQRLLDRQAECRRLGEPAPARLPAREPLSNVPSGITGSLNRDLEAAGIPKRDERDRVVDIHALRVSLAHIFVRPACRCARLRLPCATASPSSRPTSTAIRNCSTSSARSSRCQD